MSYIAYHMLENVAIMPKRVLKIPGKTFYKT